MHKSPPLVSIIIPTYNRRDIVTHAVESALAQDYPARQIIVVDDGSSDDTIAVLQRYTSIELISQPNQGAGAARNRGLSAAKGDYVATLDSDDRWDPNYLSYGIQRIQQYGVPIFFSNWQEVGPKGEVDCADYFTKAKLMQPYRSLANADNDVVLSAEQTRDLFLKALPAPSSGLIMRRDLMQGWDRGLTIGEDWLMVLKAILQKPVPTAFTMRRLWTKMRDGKNIFDQLDVTPQLRHQLAVDAEKIGSQVMNFLSPAEQKQFRALIAGCFFDYAYSISKSHPKRALSSYSRSNRYAFRPRTCAAMLKTIVKALVPGLSSR